MFLGAILLIQQVAALVQAGITTAKSMAEAVKAGKLAVVDHHGGPITPDQIEAETAKLIAHAGEVGDQVAARVEARHKP